MPGRRSGKHGDSRVRTIYVLRSYARLERGAYWSRGEMHFDEAEWTDALARYKALSAEMRSWVGVGRTLTSQNGNALEGKVVTIGVELLKGKGMSNDEGSFVWMAKPDIVGESSEEVGMRTLVFA